MGSVLGLGVIDLALGILVMAPLSVVLRRNRYLSEAFLLAFGVCAAIGMALIFVAGLLALGT
ncbi:hypothetical protein [Symbiobacterium thermophilum]|jgi:hypothetical protein|uniref:Uncharacterized protein n=1 Tax=Symbiobacterium thermophilum TaxID=2734 RepID=A0A1Y2T5B8_SYMTR|nr:hypothetical protein [Symbiobacterium thermophilum]MBY6274801.1 hypothetical protein [Symbiobacterium thermophilum]OTA41650.1 MAG: hypothetical protein A6D92_04915 [Symbiobacterium thermophilum]